MTDWYQCINCKEAVSEFDTAYDLEKKACAICACFLFSSADLYKPQKPIKIVPKTWGFEEWIANSPMYCSKILHINPNDGTSIHHHKFKYETMRVLEGTFRIFLEGELLIMKPGDIINISPYQVHKIDALQYKDKCQLLEVSTQHFDDDSIRHGRDLLKYLEEKGVV